MNSYEKESTRFSLCHREPRQLERGAGATAEDDLGASPRVSAKQILGRDGFARYCERVFHTHRGFFREERTK